MKGHTFVGVTRSCGGVQDLTENDQENVKRGSASRLSGKQRKSVIVASAQQKEQERKCKKRLRDQQLSLRSAFLDRSNASSTLHKRACREGKHTLKSASLQLMEHAQPTKFTRNLRETTTTQTTTGAVTVKFHLLSHHYNPNTASTHTHEHTH